MVYINIPFVVENNRIDKDHVKNEIQFLDIGEHAKKGAYAAIFNIIPRGVEFTGESLKEVVILEQTLQKLGIPYRRSEESEY